MTLKLLIKFKFDREEYCERKVKSSLLYMKKFWILIQLSNKKLSYCTFGIMG